MANAPFIIVSFQQRIIACNLLKRHAKIAQRQVSSTARQRRWAIVSFQNTTQR